MIRSLEDPHLFRPDRRLMWDALARRVEADPECLALPLANIERWMAHGRLHRGPLVEWRARLTEARTSREKLTELLAYMRADNDDSEQLKSCSPFPGLLTAEELQACYPPKA